MGDQSNLSTITDTDADKSSAPKLTRLDELHPDISDEQFTPHSWDWLAKMISKLLQVSRRMLGHWLNFCHLKRTISCRSFDGGLRLKSSTKNGIGTLSRSTVKAESKITFVM